MHRVTHFALRATLATSLLLLLGGSSALANVDFGPMINAFCTANGREPAAPFTGDCAMCHAPGTFDKLPEHQLQPNWDEFKAGKLISDFSFFCPAVPQMNDPPVLDPIGDQALNEGETLTIQVSATDPNGDALRLEAANLPTGASFADQGNGTAAFVWTPSAGQAGNHPVTFLVSDAWNPPGTDSEEITITVGALNRPPVLDPIGNREAQADQLLSVAIAASDPDGDALGFTAANAPTGASLMDHGDGTAELLWTPSAEQAGNHVVTVLVSDDGIPAASDSEEITITVGGVDANHPPVLDPIGNRTLGEGELLALTITASDPDGGALHFAADGLPAGASFSDHGNGSAELSWQPAPGELGNYAVTFLVSDAWDPPATDAEEITITVGAVNRPPTLDPIGDRSLGEGEPVSILLTASDPDGDALQFGVDDLPSGAQLEDYGDGTAAFHWTASDQPGLYPLTVSVSDDALPPASDAEEITLTVGTPSGGTGGIYVTRAWWDPESKSLHAKVGGVPMGTLVDILDADSGMLLRTKRSGEDAEFGVTVKSFLAPCTIQARAGDALSERVAVAGAPADCGAEGPLHTRVKRAAWRLHYGEWILVVHGDRAPASATLYLYGAEGEAPLGTVETNSKGQFRYRGAYASPPCPLSIGFMLGGVEKYLEPVAVEGTETICGGE
jgi:hypothetical protein